MQAKYKWLLLPPSIALILFLGPFRDSVGTTAPASGAEAATAQSSATPGTGLPSIPGMDQIVSTLIGVLLLGAVGIIVFAKMRKPRTRGAGSGLVEHRQSLRVTAKHHVHVLQFDGQMILLGTSDSNMTVLRTAESSDGAVDELELAARDLAEDEGAVPKDLIIPRPARRNAPAAKTLNMAQFNKLLAKARDGQA